MLTLDHSFFNHMPWWIFGAIVVMFSYFGWMVLKQVFFSLRNARYIIDTPTSLIRSAPQGYVELEGTALPIPVYQQRAPLTYKPCCWYSYKVEEHITQIRDNVTESWWQEVVSGTSPHLFLIKDKTGKCVISPIGAQITTSHHLTWETRQLPPHLQLRSHSPDRLFRFTESRIEKKDSIYVLGHFETVHTRMDLHHSEDYSSLQPKHTTSRVKNLFFPQSQDIQTANQEWQTLQEKFEQAEENAVQEIHLIKDNPISDQPYLISNYSQKTLAWRYRIKAFFYMLLFFILASIPFIMLVSRFSLITSS